MPQDMGRSKVTIALSNVELEALNRYCAEKNRTQADVLRGFIWSLMTTREKISVAHEKEPLMPTTYQFLRSTVVMDD